MALPAWASDRGSHSSFIPVPSPCQHIFWRGDHPVRSPFSGVLAAPSLYSRPLPNCRYAGWGLTLLLPSFSSCLLYQLSILRHKYRHKSKGWCSRQGLLQEVKELSLAGGKEGLEEEGSDGQGPGGTAGAFWAWEGRMGTVFQHLKDLMFDSGSAWWPSSRPRSVARFLPPSSDPDMLDPPGHLSSHASR